MLKRWIFADAEWWQFWRPQSGVIGGALGGAVILVAIVLHALWLH